MIQMEKMSYVKKIIITAQCVALCIVLPLAFHMIPAAGPRFLPMHIPVLLCGLICGWQFGLITGVMGPILSSLITGMPPMLFLPNMTVELAFFGIVTGVMMLVVRTGKLYVDLYVSLIIAMIVGRIVGGIAMALIFSPGGYSFAIWTTTYFVTAIPGIVIQLVLIPSIIVALEAARLIPRRYPKECLMQNAEC